MFNVCNYVPDNNLPYLTFEKCQGYVSLSAPTRKAALLLDQYAEMQLSTGLIEEGCWDHPQMLLKSSTPSGMGWGSEGRLEAYFRVV